VKTEILLPRKADAAVHRVEDRVLPWQPEPPSFQPRFEAPPAPVAASFQLAACNKMKSCCHERHMRSIAPHWPPGGPVQHQRPEVAKRWLRTGIRLSMRHERNVFRADSNLVATAEPSGRGGALLLTVAASFQLAACNKMKSCCHERQMRSIAHHWPPGGRPQRQRPAVAKKKWP